MKYLKLIAISCCAALFVGCASIKPPLYNAEGFQPQQMDVVYVMPVVDARVDKELETPFNKIIQKDAMRILKHKKYVAEKVGEEVVVVDLTLDDIQEESPELIKSIGPEGSRWIMLFVLEDLSRKVSFGASANAEVRMVILDKEKGIVVWRDKSVIQTGQGGLVAMALAGTMDNDALHQAVYDLLHRKLPKNKS